jgi:hypothetical protein
LGKITRALILTVLLMAVSVESAYADSSDTGWKGYGLYNLNKSDVNVSLESDYIVIDGESVNAKYEYTIVSNDSKDIAVNFGIPDNGIIKFSVHDGSKYLSYKTRNAAYLKNNYGAVNLQTPDVRWYLFTMVFKPGQTRTIKVSIEAEMVKEENDTYGLGFFKDRNYNYAIKSDKTWFTLKLNNFKPYYIFELESIREESISDEGIVNLSFSGDYGNGAFMRYQPIDKMALDSIGKSRYKKPKEIVKAFNNKSYEEALTLCNEYISAPSDNNLSIEQVEYLKAECLRLSGNNEEYLNALEKLDISQLYPGRIRYKILHDKLKAYDDIENDEGKNIILKELIPETQKSYPYLYYWLDKNGYRLAEDKTDVSDIAPPQDNDMASVKNKGFDILGAIIGFFNFVAESRWTYVLLGFLVGFVVGRLTKRKKKRKPVYLFRD